MRLVRWLEATIESKQRKGETIPAEILAWLQLWQALRGGLPVAEVDTLAPGEWDEIGEAIEAVGEYVTQGVLVEAPAKKKGRVYA